MFKSFGVFGNNPTIDGAKNEREKRHFERFRKMEWFANEQRNSIYKQEIQLSGAKKIMGESWKF